MPRGDMACEYWSFLCAPMEVFGSLDATQRSLFVLAPFAGFLGSMVAALMLRNDLQKLPPPPPPANGPLPSNWPRLSFVWARANWWFAWAVVGVATGLLLSLLFFDTVNGTASLMRMLATALLGGYGAASVWTSQSGAVAKVLVNPSAQTNTLPESRTPLGDPASAPSSQGEDPVRR